MTSLGSVTSPLDDYLEVPRALQLVWDRHAERIELTLRDARSAIMDLLVDLATQVWSLQPDVHISAEELRVHGFDPGDPAPDMED